VAFHFFLQHSRSPYFCSDEGKKTLTNLNSTHNLSDSEKGHGNNDGKTSSLLSHVARERKSFTKVLRLLQQKIEFDSRESLTGSDNNRVHTKLKSQFTTKNVLRSSAARGAMAENDDDDAADVDERKQNDSKQSLESLLDVMLDILKKKCDQRWIPRDFLKLLKKLSLFFVEEAEMSIRGQRARNMKKKKMQINNLSETKEYNDKTDNNITDSSDNGGNDAVGKSQQFSKTNDNDKERAPLASTGKLSIKMPFWNEIKTMMRDCFLEVNKSEGSLNLVAGYGEPNIVSLK